MAKEEAQAQRGLFDDTSGASSAHSTANDAFEIIDIESDEPDTNERLSQRGRTRRMSRGIKQLRRSNVALVTTASYSPTQNRKKREKQYMWIQGVRLPFLIVSMATYVWMHNIWLSALLFIISVPLPWIAVVIANGIGEPRDPRAPAVYKPALAREQATALAASNTPSLGSAGAISELPPGSAARDSQDAPISLDSDT